MIVAVQIGYAKAFGRKKEGQLVRAFLNDEELSWSDRDYDGKYITSKVESNKGKLWYMCKLEVEPQDVLRVECKTFVVGAGSDEARTFESLYYADEAAEVREIFISGVGKRGFPLIKGRVIELGSVSEADKRQSELMEFLRDGF